LNNISNIHHQIQLLSKLVLLLLVRKLDP